MILSKNNPWKGLDIYREGDIIYGRDEDIRKLSQYVLGYNETVLYGRSGIGKSSLLNAGILPVARIAGFIPIYIRLNHSNEETYFEQIKTAIEKYGVIIQPVGTIKDIERPLLWELFHRNRFINQENGSIKLLLIFDQFEEIFTLQHNIALRKQFFYQVGSVLNNVMPNELEGTNADLPETFAGQESKLKTGLVMKVRKASPNSNTKFIDNNTIHIVFTLREDFLSDFEYFTSAIPSLKQHRYGLRPISKEQAAEIILRPRKGLVAEDVANLIIKKVTQRPDFDLDGINEIDVDSAVLSLYMNRLYESHIGDKITAELVEEKGDAIIKKFYEKSIEDIDNNKIEYLEDILVNDDNRRENKSLNMVIKSIGQVCVDKLIARCILRKFVLGRDFKVEFIHDILCPVVKERKEQRQLRIQQEIERKKQEEELKRICLEEEAKRKSLLEEYKKEISKEKERRKQKNRNKILQSQNVLNIRGRQIWDNKSFSFSVDNTRSNTLQNSSDRFDTDFTKLNSNNEQRGELFLEELLDQFVNSDRLSLDFKEQQSKDGISCFDIHTCFCNGKRKIKHVFFYNTTKSNESETTVDFYTKDGFHGISIDYDKSGREIRIKYMCDGFTSVGISSIDFYYNDEGLPICAKYFDAYDKPCKHCDGNYGVKIEYDEYGNEIKRWFINQYCVKLIFNRL